MSRTLVLLAAATLGAGLGAQTATYTTFGAGCPGSGAGNYCLSSNPNGGSLTLTQNSNIFALEVNATSATVVLGFELYTQALSGPITLTTEVLPADSTGKPGTPALRTGSMLVNPAAGWYRTTFTPLVLTANTKFFLSYGSRASQMMFPIVSGGTNAIHYWHSPTASAWSGPFTTQPWAWRVICPGGQALPVLANVGVPSLGNTLNVTLDQARATAPAALMTGASNVVWGPFNLPLDLTLAGAKGCNLLVSVDFLAPIATDGNGQASAPIFIPNATPLLGAVFHQQWLINDTVNSLGWVFSNGGTARIGR